MTLGTLFGGAAAAAGPASAQARPPAVQVVTANPPPVLAQQGPATIHVGANSYRYVVERHDTLSKISKQWLGDANRWPEICELNWHRHFKVGGTMRDCNLIYPGWDLRLPADAKPPADATPHPPHPRQPPTRNQTPARPSSRPPHRQPAARRHPRTRTAWSNPVGHAVRFGHDRRAGCPASSHDVHSAGHAEPVRHRVIDHDRPHHNAEPDQHRESGGRRRQRQSGRQRGRGPPARRQLRPVDPGRRDRRRHRHGVAATPPPLHPRRAGRRRRFAGAAPARDGVAPPGHPQPRPAHAQRPGRTRRRRARPPLLPPGGVGLVGDGAHAAARAALISSLASGGPREPDRRGEVVIDGTTLTTLIGADAAALGPWPRLHVADDIDHALSILDSRLLHRARVLDEHSLTDLDALRESAPDEEALPPVLLICETPLAGARMRARVSFGLGNGLDVSALLLGEWPHGSTITVTADGHTSVVDGPAVEAIGERVAVLDTAEAVAILTTLREAHTGEPPNPVLRARAAPRPPAPASDPAPMPPATSDPTTHDPTTSADADAAEPSDHSLDAPPPAVGGTPRVKASLRVLGAPIVEDLVLPGRDLRGRAAELAVFLACHPDGADTETIAEHLVPDVRRRQAKQLVHTNASNLRHVLGRAGGPITAGYVLKRGASARYRLDPTTVRVDLWQLRDLLSRAQIASAPARAELLRDACALYTAPLADGCDYEWVEPHREKARQWGTEAHLLLADDLIESDPQAASDLLDKAIDLDHYNEELYRKAMHTRHALHDADGIRTLLRALTKALADLDAEPAETTVELAAKLRTSLEQQ
ncbi:LysM peptidoglycan-binding domain-containing protein [Micromonospora sp. Llam7]|uniref:LysM peptidoglycan-binding domain-containing protein n=1 Tax=Micromonospora tarapacensis TaxID=2835305 RepID=UPI001C83C661|nr:LysM peptidoglycan-binding domain-containing protein [Micromonospora tarapacensis]MBX7267589.1 LysM peptidoglycan-binding domain-containing protein [Micromonospora tarapacensis]